jgi:branched-chain amino acid transport system permease protein
VALACLALVIFLGRLADARFGHTIQAIRENETRMEALGYPVFRYRLVCFALGGALAGLAGALLANLTGLASPNLLQWMQSGTLLVMVIIGGVGYLYGGVVGCRGVADARGGAGRFHLALAPIGLGLLLAGHCLLFAPKGRGGPVRESAMAEALLEVRDLSRRFAAVDALKAVNFTRRRRARCMR